MNIEITKNEEVTTRAHLVDDGGELSLRFLGKAFIPMGLSEDAKC